MKEEVRKEHICGIDCVSEKSMEEKRNRMPSDLRISQLSDFFKILGDGTRLRILFAVDSEPLCVCEICAVLGMTKSAVSHQLKILRQSNLVRSERRGKNIYYELADEHVRDIIEKALEHIEEI